MQEEESFPSISYDFGTLEYALIYYAVNVLALDTEENEGLVREIADHLKVSPETVHQKLEEILTDNADPDRDE